MAVTITPYTPTYLPVFSGFTDFVPTIPKLYWDVRSQEQRILNMFKLLDKLVEYVDLIASTYNENADKIVELQQAVTDLQQQITDNLATLQKDMTELAATLREECEESCKTTEQRANAYTDDQLQAYATIAALQAEAERVNVLVEALQTALDAVNKRIEEIEASSMQWDVSEAKYEDSITAQRHMFAYVTAQSMDCDELATHDDITCDTLNLDILNVRGFAAANYWLVESFPLAKGYRTAEVATRTVTNTDGTTTTYDIPDGSITARKLADKAVTTPKLNDSAVTGEKMASMTVNDLAK